MLQKVSEQVAECLRRAAEAEACAERTNDAKNKIDYQRMADTWRTLARSYEFQGSLGAKHGSLSYPNGRVFVDWRGNGGNIALTWKECGGAECKNTKQTRFWHSTARYLY